MLWQLLSLLFEVGESRSRARAGGRGDAESEAIARAVARELTGERRLRAEEEQARVDPDFLALVWASIAAALAFAGHAAQRSGPLRLGQIDAVQAIWFVLAVIAGLFVVTNVAFAIRLTRQYAQSKSDPGYRFYATWLAVTIGVIVAGAVGLVVIGAMN